MHRKLRKLFRDPMKFVADARLFGGATPPARPAPVQASASVPISRPQESEAALVVEAPQKADPVAVAKEIAEADGDAGGLAEAEADPEPDAEGVDAEASDEAGPITGIPGYEHFELHGQNWLDAPAQPVAVLWGFAAWQRNFVAEYLPENRAAFVDAKTAWPDLETGLDRLDGLRFIVWGHSEDAAVCEYAQRRGIATARMADGFIRSVSRGSEPTRPYSMVLDASGLEWLLDNHDFAASKSLLNAVPALMHLHRKLGISKYSTASFLSGSRLLGPKLMRRILVVGERTAAAWTAQRLVELAVAENPGAEVVFRPHPDNIRAYRKGSAAWTELSRLCRVITEDIALPEVLRAVDQVYVDSSPGGMEALIHGLPVTVVGSPFYAGRGLTDDRQAIARCERRCSLEELYCAAYLLYPRYLADLDDPVTGCVATMLCVAAERRQRLDGAIGPELVRRDAATIARTDCWPALLRPENFAQLTSRYGTKLFRAFSLEQAFAQSKAERFQRSVACLLVGQFHKVPGASGMLPRLRKLVRTSVYRQVLLDFWRMEPSPAILEQLAWCCEKAGEFGDARALLEHLAFGGEIRKDPASRLPFSSADAPRVLRLASFELQQKQLGRAEQLFNELLLSGCMQPEVFAGLASVASLRFDFGSAAALLGIARRLYPAWDRGAVHVLHAEACVLAGDGISALESKAVACLAHPHHLAAASAIASVLDRQIGKLPYDEAMLVAMELGEPDNVIGRAKGLITHERHAEAEQLLLAHAPRRTRRVKHALTLSLAYTYQGKMSEAMALVSRLLTTSPTLPVFREGLRLAVAANDYAWGKALLIAARELQLDIGHIYPRKIAFGLGEIKEAYLTMRRTKGAATLGGYLGARYVQSLHSLSLEPGAINLVVASLGPGDEIRYASLYRQMREAGGDARVMFTCDPRLLGLLSRHYTDLEFVPTARIRSLDRLAHFNNHDQLAGSDLHRLFDNRGWAAAREADKVIRVTDALGDVIDSYASLEGRPCLKADPALVQQWRHRLPQRRNGELLVGLSWRSSLMSYRRNEHYLAVEDLLPLFELEGVRFVNLQYDDCREEVAWLEERLPGRLLHFEDLDQFNDLDGVAALMECLDLVVSAGTAVFELAGALGRPTLLLTNSSEAHWRKVPGSRVDVWQNSVVHVEAPLLGDKNGLVRELASEIQRLVATRPHVPEVQRESQN